jgi:hypothetical protein
MVEKAAPDSLKIIFTCGNAGEHESGVVFSAE